MKKLSEKWCRTCFKGIRFGLEQHFFWESPPPFCFSQIQAKPVEISCFTSTAMPRVFRYYIFYHSSTLGHWWPQNCNETYLCFYKSKGDLMFWWRCTISKSIRSYGNKKHKWLRWKLGRTISGDNRVHLYRYISKEQYAIWLTEIHFKSDLTLY